MYNEEESRKVKASIFGGVFKLKCVIVVPDCALVQVEAFLQTTQGKYQLYAFELLGRLFIRLSDKHNVDNVSHSLVTTGIESTREATKKEMQIRDRLND